MEITTNTIKKEKDQVLGILLDTKYTPIYNMNIINFIKSYTMISLLSSHYTTEEKYMERTIIITNEKYNTFDFSKENFEDKKKLGDDAYNNFIKD